MEVNIGPYNIEIIIVYKKNKNIYMRVKEDLKLYITCHPLVSKKELLKLIQTNEKSIIKMYEKMLKTNQYENEFYYLGDKYEVVFDENINSPEINGSNIYLKNEKMLNKFWQDECKRIFSKRVQDLKILFPYLPKFSLKIRKMKSRWGVCNRSNNTVTLNSELLKKDLSLLDYVIIHEFCHFKHPNHSAAFWQEVSKHYPYYKLARKRLKEV